MLICVTNRQLCRENFLDRVERLARAGPQALLLREKDLEPAAYEQLAGQVQEICLRHGVQLILQQNLAAAKKLAVHRVQVPLTLLGTVSSAADSLSIGVSVHSAAEAKAAQAGGAAYVVAGHVFATSCKPGLPPRGLAFLRQVCQTVDLPVFAIGGISAANIEAVMQCGARGICVMSEAMLCRDPAMMVRDYTRLIARAQANDTGNHSATRSA